MNDNEMVKVNLDVQRMYRVNHEDKEAITVGPGEAMVPAWVKAHWEESSKPAAPHEPPLSDDERALHKLKVEALTIEYGNKIAALQDELRDVRAERDALKARLEPKTQRDDLPRGVPRPEQAKLPNGGKKVN